MKAMKIIGNGVFNDVAAMWPVEISMKLLINDNRSNIQW